jgi:SulP family sulfate permease
MAVVAWQLGRSMLTSPGMWTLALASLVLLRAGVHSAWLVAAGAAAGVLLHQHPYPDLPELLVLVPKLVTTLRTYDRAQFVADLGSVVIVGIVALPLAIAFAIASGVTPDRGLYTAIIAGFLISALGGSRVQIGGPTGAFVVIVYGIVQKYGVDGLMVATLMGGLMLVTFGLARLGGAIKFIPFPVVTGFTFAIGLLLMTLQVLDALGLRIEHPPAQFIERISAYGANLSTANPYAIGLAGFTLLILTQWPRVTRKIPSAFVALIAGTVVVRLLHLPVETIGSRFGEFSMGVPRPSLPHVSLSTLRELVAPAFTIAALGAIESLLSAVVSDGMIGGRHRSNMELVAQGIANIASPVFGGMPATGAIARTATNVKNGGRTPVAGITHALVLVLIVLFFGRWAGLIPLATLAAIVIIAAYHLSDWRVFVSELRAPKSDMLVMVTTGVLTLLADLPTAVGVGIVLASFLFMKRMA